METAISNGEGRIGLDIGTSKLMTIRQAGNQLKASIEVNAFLPLPYSRITENILLQNKIHYYQSNGHFYVYGNNAEKFAGLFNSETRRPMSRGLINPNEPSALTLIKVMLQGLLKKPKAKGELVCFSVPGAPADSPNDSHLSRAAPERVPGGARLRGEEHQRRAGHRLLRARGGELHGNRYLRRRRNVQRLPGLPVGSGGLLFDVQSRRLHRPERRLGHRRVGDPREDGEGAVARF